MSGRKVAAPPRDVLGALFVELRAIRELLERLALGASDAPYSTRRGQEPPEFVGRRKAWRLAARTIPGATKSGRWTYISRPAYAAWLASQAGPLLRPANDAGVPWTPRSALLSVGLRPTRERSR